MATEYYELPVSLDWLKANLKIIIGNRDLNEILTFGDLWRSRGHVPLVHVLSPAMDNGQMWDQHADPSGLLDNVPSHIDMFIVDFNNRLNPKLPKAWEDMKEPPKWLLWEFQAGKVKFNGTYEQFVRKFGCDPAAAQPTHPTTPLPDSQSGDSFIHLKCPHCGNIIF